MMKAEETTKLKAALDVVRTIKIRSTSEVGMYSDDHVIDLCDTITDGLIDLLESCDDLRQCDRHDCNEPAVAEGTIGCQKVAACEQHAGEIEAEFRTL